MKKNLFSLSIISAALLVSTSINATTPIDPQELTVSGQFAAGNCDVSVSNNIYDLGTIPVKLIHAAESNWLSVDYNRTKNWSVICASATTMQLKIEDNRAASSLNSSLLFGLGHVNNTGKIGGFAITLTNPKVDEQDAMLAISGQESLEPLSVAPINPNDEILWVGTNGTRQPISGSKFSADITTRTKLGSKEDMNGPIVGGAELDGSATLTFTYGI